MPRGCRVLHLQIRRPSALRLSLVLWRPARTTATIISSVVRPGEEKCLATGRSAFFETDLRCSQNLSPSLRPVSPTYDRVHARQVMIYTRLLVVHENLCRMVRGSPGVLILEAGLVHRGCWSGRLGWFTGGVDLGGWVGPPGVLIWEAGLVQNSYRPAGHLWVTRRLEWTTSGLWQVWIVVCS